MTFEFATAQRILFGPDTAARIPDLARTLCRRPLRIGGKDPARYRSIPLDSPAPMVSIPGEPDFDRVREAVDLARRHDCDGVVAIGGGSVIDAGKAVAMLLANGGDPMDYAEVVGTGKPIQKTSVPLIAVPTTAGAGSEVTRNAVLREPVSRLKVSLRAAGMLPSVAVVDPALTIGLPPDLTAATGLDALTQLIEPFLSNRANPLTDALCREGISRVFRALPRAIRRGDDLDARTDMAFAATLGGMALANAGLGAVHGFAAAIGGRFEAPHGAVCAILLAPVLRANCAYATGERVTSRLREIAVHAMDRPAEPAELIEWIANWVAELGIPRLSTWGVTDADLDSLARAAAASNSMKANPVPLSHEVLCGILAAAC